MPELKILTHTTYTYETSDGRTFDDDREAAEHWQQSLDNLSGITMLDSKFNKTLRHDEAFYVHIKTWEQQEAFEALQLYEGMGAHIPKPGFWYYDECTDSYVNIAEEINKLQDMISKLNC
jgi:hypothetical protein